MIYNQTGFCWPSDALAGSVSSTGGLYIVPAFSGLFAPYWRPDARGYAQFVRIITVTRSNFLICKVLQLDLQVTPRKRILLEPCLKLQPIKVLRSDPKNNDFLCMRRVTFFLIRTRF